MDARTEIVTHLLATRNEGRRIDKLTDKDINDAFIIADKIIRKNNEIIERINRINSNSIKEVYDSYKPELPESGDY